jgi:hypothetical protein
MDSLTTSYIFGLFLGSIGSFVGAYIGNKILPIESSLAEPSVQTIEQTPSPAPQNTAQIQPEPPSITS